MYVHGINDLEWVLMCECGWVWQNVCIFQYTLVFFLFIIIICILFWRKALLLSLWVSEPILAETQITTTLILTTQSALF